MAKSKNPEVVESVARYHGAVNTIRGLSQRDLLKTIDEKIALALMHIDEVSLGKANAAQLGVVFGILTEKKLLLEGRPTAIYSVKELENITKIVPGLLRELGRRGVTIDAVPDEPTRMFLPEKTEADLNATDRNFKVPMEDQQFG